MQQKNKVYPGFVYKLKTSHTLNAVALTDSLFAIPGEPPTTLESGETYELFGNGISKNTKIRLVDKILGVELIHQYGDRGNRINESLMYEIWSTI